MRRAGSRGPRETFPRRRPLFRSRFVAATTRALILIVPFGADAPDLAFLQRAEQFGLNRGRDLADFIEEDRAVPGHLEQAGLVARRPRERPANVSEQLRFEQVSVSAAQLIDTNGAAARGLCS